MYRYTHQEIAESTHALSHHVEIASGLRPHSIVSFKNHCTIVNDQKIPETRGFVKMTISTLSIHSQFMKIYSHLDVTRSFVITEWAVELGLESANGLFLRWCLSLCSPPSHFSGLPLPFGLDLGGMPPI